jgi:perosamine synthetase
VIPVFQPFVSEDDMRSVIEALQRGEISGTFGKTIEQFEEGFARFIGSRYGIAVSSGTAALQLAVAAAGIGAGDEVLISASTNIATALAVVHNGAIPVPVDSEEVTWNLDLALLDDLVTSRTRAIIPVHLYGHPVDMEALAAFAARRGLIIIEDCAEAHGARCRGRTVGSFGTMACFSFYANKIITTGEGGMVVTDDPALARRLRSLRNLGFAEPRFRHEELGFNFRMTGFQAALGLSQLRRIEQIIDAKRALARRYLSLLKDVPDLRLPVELDWAFHVYWMFGVVLNPDARVSRENVTLALASAGIETRTFFCPMNQQPALKDKMGKRRVLCPVADRLWTDGFYLPSSPSLSADEVEHIATMLARNVSPAGARRRS